MSKNTELELTWIGKENRPRLEPRILPKGAVTTGFHNFDLDTRSVALQPVGGGRLFTQGLQSHERVYLDAGNVPAREARLEDYLVGGLVDFDDICYDEQADLLYKLAGQVVAHLRSYLPDEEAVRNVLEHHQAIQSNRTLAGLAASYSLT
jgi:type III restriction enzyme